MPQNTQTERQVAGWIDKKLADQFLKSVEQARLKKKVVIERLVTIWLELDPEEKLLLYQGVRITPDAVAEAKAIVAAAEKRARHATPRKARKSSRAG